MAYTLQSAILNDIWDTTDPSKQLSLDFSGVGTGQVSSFVFPAVGRTLTLPNVDATLVGDNTIVSVLNGKTLTGVTIDAAANTITNLGSVSLTGGAYAVGDILYADTTSSLAALAGVATGNALISGGVGAAPSYGKIGLTTHVSGTLPQANGGTGFTVYAVGDLLYANTTSTLAKLADVATGNALISGGVGVAPSWGKVSLTAAISGILPVANGGTNSSSYTVGDILYASAAGVLSKLTDVATGNALISGGVGVAPSYGKIGLTTHVSGVLPIANGGTNAATAGAALTALGAAASGANSDITSLTATTSVAVKDTGSVNKVSIVAPALAANYTLTLPADDGAASQVLSTNGSGTLSWVAQSSSTGGRGNMLYVDSVNGNDATASAGGLPYLTIGAALADATSGQQVWIFPGVYLESGLTIPTGVAVCGTSDRAVKIRAENVTTSTTMVTMGDQTYLRDVEIEVTSTTAGITIVGVLFPGTTTDKSTILQVRVDLVNTSTGAGTIIGVHSNGTGVSTSIRHNVNGCNIYITSAVTTTCRGILLDTAANTMHIRNTSVDIVRTAGAGSYIGIETNFAGTLCHVLNGSILGTTADISQTIGTIQLSGVELESNNANGLGFTVTGTSSMLTFEQVGLYPSSTVAQYYRPSGTISTVEIQFYIPSSCIFRSLNVRAGTAGNNGNILHTLRKNRVNTVLTANLLANTTSANNAANLSVSFAAGDLLSISGVLSSAAGTEPNNISIVCEYY